ELIASNCPFCMTMISDGVKEAGQDEQVKVLDICEILWNSVAD
ncbi:MAG: (Fe-S)-binding protein, partial [Firmicutes bacterium]|nr:(Fe-S)-binding protein [Bacillota bacterium]